MAHHRLPLKPTVLCLPVFLHDYCDVCPHILPLTKDTSKMPIGGPLASVEDRRMRFLQGIKRI